MRATLTRFIWPVKGGEIDYPHGATIPAQADFVSWDADELKLTYSIEEYTADGNLDGEAELSITFTQEQIDEALVAATTPQPIVLPLEQRLRAMLDDLPAPVRAQFFGLRRQVWDAIEDGDLEVAKILIESAEVPADLIEVKEAMLAEFD